MNFFKRKTTWTNGEFVILKICLVSIGIYIGIWLHESLVNYSHLFLAIYIVTGILTLYMWLYKAKPDR